MPLETSLGFITSKNVKLARTGTGGVTCTSGKVTKCTLRPDQHGIKCSNISHKIVVSAEGPVHQAEFIMEEVLSSSIKGDANGDKGHPNSDEGAPDEDAPVHGDQHSA